MSNTLNFQYLGDARLLHKAAFSKITIFEYKQKYGNSIGKISIFLYALHIFVTL